MQAFDASSIIHAWDHYPEEQFPGLWEWLDEKIAAADFAMLQVALEEVERRSPDCRQWLKENHIRALPITSATLQNALLINGLLGISNDQYGAGVGENDVLIIASAMEHGHELVTNENRQNILPSNMKKYKIPAVCGMHQISVPCISFIELIKRSKKVFR